MPPVQLSCPPRTVRSSLPCELGLMQLAGEPVGAPSISNDLRCQQTGKRPEVPLEDDTPQDPEDLQADESMDILQQKDINMQKDAHTRSLSC